MKKKVIIAAVLAICLLGGIAAMLFVNKPNPGKPTHMILNKDQSYGGSLSEKKYGKGAPLNGEYDVENSPYYVVNNDFYNMPSTKERTIFPRFSSYQQTMQDSSGLACLMMILNYMGEDADYIKVTDGNNVTIENNEFDGGFDESKDVKYRY